MIVVDASVAAKWLFPEDHSGLARDLALHPPGGDQRILAPPLLPIEVASLIRQRMRRVGLALPQAVELFEQFLAISVTTSSPPGLTQRALAIADQYGLPAVYDAHYVALAEDLHCDLWSDDQRLLRAVGVALPYVRGIGNYHSGGR
jgi:predicted nucleic acid-binding protein